MAALFAEPLEVIFEKNKLFTRLMNQIHPRNFIKFSLDQVKFQKEVGEGSFGKVYKVQVFNRDFALKIINKETINDSLNMRLLKYEKQISDVLDFPFIMKKFGELKQKDHMMFLNEYVPGATFWDVMIELDLLSYGQAKFYIAQLLIILQYLHKRGIIYRDLKPQNLICQRSGYLKMIDFGTSKNLKLNKLGIYDRTYTVVGTPHYLAPELIEGKGYSFSADYWSLGVLLFELMIGYVPFGDDCSEVF